MPQPVENMLAKWALLYPEMTGASERHDHDETARVRKEVVSPLLTETDLLHTFEEIKGDTRGGGSPWQRRNETWKP